MNSSLNRVIDDSNTLKQPLFCKVHEHHGGGHLYVQEINDLDYCCGLHRSTSIDVITSRFIKQGRNSIQEQKTISFARKQVKFATFDEFMSKKTKVPSSCQNYLLNTKYPGLDPPRFLVFATHDSIPH